jgi:hypothetical protein
MKICIILNYHKIMAGELGGPWSIHGHDENYIHNFRWQNLKRRHHLEVLRVDGRITLEYI